MGRGCEFCGCGEEGVSAEVCEGCFKLHVNDWLQDYPDNLPADIFEIRFKNTRRGYYQNVNGIPLQEGDIVAVEAAPGHDIGIVSLSGDLVARQMRRVGFNPQNGEFKKIYRKAKPYDIEKWQEAIALEHETMIKARQIAADMNLNMKIGDVEYQGDKIKAIFYYIADERVDFRELIKVFADVFHIRVEMKQIGARQEAGRIGGLGSCGRELCCASWISSFMSVTTNAARTQDISLNPQKLAGQCSKLKCCLMYEYDDYMDARKEFPRVTEPLRVMDADYYFIKNDILGRSMSFSTSPGSMAGLVSIPIERVREIMKLNAKGVKPDRLESKESVARCEADPGFVNAIGEDSITRFDNARRKKKGRGGKGRDERGREGVQRSDRPVREEGKEDRPQRKEANHDGGIAGERVKQQRDAGAGARQRQGEGNTRKPEKRGAVAPVRSVANRTDGVNPEAKRPAERSGEQTQPDRRGGQRRSPQSGTGNRNNRPNPSRRRENPSPAPRDDKETR